MLLDNLVNFFLHKFLPKNEVHLVLTTNRFDHHRASPSPLRLSTDRTGELESLPEVPSFYVSQQPTSVFFMSISVIHPLKFFKSFHSFTRCFTLSGGFLSISVICFSPFSNWYWPCCSTKADMYNRRFNGCFLQVWFVTVRGGRYVLIIHFYVESGQKMIKFNIQFKVESKIFIQKIIQFKIFKNYSKIIQLK